MGNENGDNKQAAGDMPDQSTKPTLDKSAVPDLVRHVYGLGVTSIKQFNGYDDLNFHVMVEPSHRNPHIKSICPNGYTLKILNGAESKRPAVVESQNQVMMILNRNGFSVPYPILTLDNAEWSLQRLRKVPGARWQPVDASDPASDHVVRLLAFVPGAILHTVPYTPTLMREAGAVAARITNCLKEFRHPTHETNDSMWFMRNVALCREHSWVVQDAGRRSMLETIIAQYSERVMTRLHQLPDGCLHGDLNEQNLLVSADSSGEHHISGVLDFGDSHRSAVVFELAMVIMYLMIDCEHVPRLDVGGHVLAGYRQHRQLTQLERSLLKTCVCARFVQSLVLGAHAFHQNPSNQYVLVTATNGWTALRQIWDEPEDQLWRRWDKIGAQYQM